METEIEKPRCPTVLGQGSFGTVKNCLTKDKREFA